MFKAFYVSSEYLNIIIQPCINALKIRSLFSFENVSLLSELGLPFPICLGLSRPWRIQVGFQIFEQIYLSTHFVAGIANVHIFGLLQIYA